MCVREYKTRARLALLTKQIDAKIDIFSIFARVYEFKFSYLRFTNSFHVCVCHTNEANLQM
jgi:hypothetical protein